MIQATRAGLQLPRSKRRGRRGFATPLRIGPFQTWRKAGGLATRNPTLLFSFVGVLLLRFGDLFPEVFLRAGHLPAQHARKRLAFHAFLRLIPCMASRGHPVHEASESDLREVHEGSYRIIYRMQDHDLLVVTIVHMKQRLMRKRLR